VLLAFVADCGARWPLETSKVALNRVGEVLFPIIRPKSYADARGVKRSGELGSLHQREQVLLASSKMHDVRGVAGSLMKARYRGVPGSPPAFIQAPHATGDTVL
jgi:hypothetical protein